ncbi:MAG: SDR family oxidoreductase [Alphaproteobacteria bacterium]|nr:SDR family oxidoreductase [Alphaproteobacteria bacterium SS10]
MDYLADKVIIITGASKGIGAAAAEYLADKGAKVVVAARSASALEELVASIKDAGGIAQAVACDVSDYTQVKALAETTKQAYGRIDVLVNNAGIIDPVARMDEIDPADWDKVIDINVKGVFYAAHSVLPAMLAEGAGTIINISSGAAYNALEGWSHYCASKAAVLSLTRSLHKEYSEHGIRAVGLSPGTVATDMQRTIKSSGVNPVSQMDFAQHIPAEWVAKAIAYLCNPVANLPLGADFTLKTDAERAAVGLPPVG